MGEVAEVSATQWQEWLETEYAKRQESWSDVRAQMPLLYDAARSYDRPVIAELGTRTGQSTSALLAGASRTGGHVWSVDPGEVKAPSWWAETGMWSFLAADDMSDEAARWVPARLDVLFIDTSHLYEHTLAELRRYVPRVRPGGTVLCHDVELTRTGDPRPRDWGGIPGGVMGEAWAAEAASGPEFPVAAALDTYCAEMGLAWERQARPQGDEQLFYGLGTIVVPAAPVFVQNNQMPP